MESKEIKIALIILLVFCTLGCSKIKKSAKNKIEGALNHIHWIQETDDFYARSSGWDYIRLPLIEPYEATNITGDEWLLDNDLINPSGSNTAGNIYQVSVLKPYIFIYCDKPTLVDSHKVDSAWYIINTEKNELSTFLTYKEYNEYLREQKITRPEMYIIDSIWNEFDRTGKLPWK